MTMRIIGMAGLITIVLLAAGTALAADITLGDDCTLAQAIDAADADEAVGGCEPGDGADTIRLTANVLLSSELPAVDTALTINGLGSYFISGDNRYRIFVVGETGDLTLRNLTLARAYPRAGGASCGAADGAAQYGGMACNLGTLRILDSRLIFNRARRGGAIYNLGGELRINGGRFENNTADGDGGAIYLAEGRASISSSSFLRNMAAVDGGALFSRNGDMDIRGSLFFSNEAVSGDGGALDSAGGAIIIRGVSFASNAAADDGGAIRASGSKLDIDASAFSGNQASDLGGAIHSNLGNTRLVNTTLQDNSSRHGGAISTSDQEASLKHLTIVGNRASQQGGGIFVCCQSGDEGGHLYLRHNILAGNTGGDCVMGASAVMEDGSDNLIGDGSCGADAESDPLLGELAYPSGGGPAYFPLLSGSPAIDAGDAFLCSASDQIGTARPQGEGCDIGAIEFTG